MRESFSSPARLLVEALSNENLTVEELPSLCSECQRLAALSDCPCPSTLKIAQLVIAAVHQPLDAAGHQTEQAGEKLKSIFRLLAHTINQAAAADDDGPWTGLHAAMQKLDEPDLPVN